MWSERVVTGVVASCLMNCLVNLLGFCCIVFTLSMILLTLWAGFPLCRHVPACGVYSVEFVFKVLGTTDVVRSSGE